MPGISKAKPRHARVEAESSKHDVSAAVRHRMIAEAAYCLAERRGFADGDVFAVAGIAPDLPECF